MLISLRFCIVSHAFILIYVDFLACLRCFVLGGALVAKWVPGPKTLETLLKQHIHYFMFAIFCGVRNSLFDDLFKDSSGSLPGVRTDLFIYLFIDICVYSRSILSVIASTMPSNLAWTMRLPKMFASPDLAHHGGENFLSGTYIIVSKYYRQYLYFAAFLYTHTYMHTFMHISSSSASVVSNVKCCSPRLKHLCDCERCALRCTAWHLTFATTCAIALIHACCAGRPQM